VNLRKIISLTALLAFLCTVVSSTVLFICPPGRVAYWASWRLWGLSKEQWGDLHINLGALFLLALGLHVYYNWTPLLSYLKDRARNLRVFTPSFAVALVLCLATLLGTLGQVPPFSSLLLLATGFKDDAARIYGEPPYGHAELSSLSTFAKKAELDLAESLARLKAAGIQLPGTNPTVLQVAEANRMSPQQVYRAMLPADKPRAAGLPATPPAGTGGRTLADLCAEYGLNLPDTLRGLADQGIKAEPGRTLRDIAADNTMSPPDLYEALRRTAGS